jgi:hypothetical protein
MAPRPLFALEALQADHGDCLLLRWGTVARPHLRVIDGGPGGIYQRSLLPRLRELGAEDSGNTRLPIDMVMVSHLDDDHINGIVDLLTAMNTSAERSVGRLWHNSFDDLVGRQPGRLERLLGAGLPASVSGARAAALVASVGQARAVRDLAQRLAIPVNTPFGGVITATRAAGRFVLPDSA